MDVGQIYTLALGSLFTVIIGWHIAAATEAHRLRALSFLRRYGFHATVIRRQKGSLDVSVAAACGLGVIVAANAIACVFQVPSTTALSYRVALISSINLVPLFLGRQTGYLIDRILRLPPLQHGLLHRWIGRLCLLQAILHAYLEMSSRWSFSAVQISMLSCVVLLALLSFLYIRRAMYEVFLKVHALLSLVLVTMLWFHIPIAYSLPFVCVASASTLWALQQGIWVCQAIYRHVRGEASAICTISCPSASQDPMDVITMRLVLSRPMRVKDGQYILITVPSTQSILGRWQSHPFLVAWSDRGLEESSQILHLILQRRNGFSNRICLHRDSQVKAFVAGPFGRGPRLNGFDKTLFLASGVGIAAHLLTIRHLLYAHEERSARVRRISLLWLVEKAEQEQWALDFLHQLLDLDMSHRRILTVHIYLPHQGAGAEPTVQVDAVRSRLFRIKGPLELGWFLRQESSAEAGNMALSVCGSPIFESRVRAATRHCKHDMHIVTSSFAIDESSASKAAAERYHERSLSTAF